MIAILNLIILYQSHSGQFHFVVLVSLKNCLHLILPQQQTVLRQLLLSVLPILRLAHRVVVSVRQIGHKGRRVLFGQHLTPIYVLQPRMSEQLLNPPRPQSIRRLSLQQPVNEIYRNRVPIFGQLMGLYARLVEQHLLSYFLTVIPTIRSLNNLKSTFPSMHS